MPCVHMVEALDAVWELLVAYITVLLAMAVYVVVTKAVGAAERNDVLLVSAAKVTW